MDKRFAANNTHIYSRAIYMKNGLNLSMKIPNTPSLFACGTFESGFMQLSCY